MVAVQSLGETVAGLAKAFNGQLLQSSDPDYEHARRVHNGLIDKRPALIARCRGTSDIVDAVKVARDHRLEVAVRGGGHNVAGRSTTDGGLMIDLSVDDRHSRRSTRRAPPAPRAASRGTCSTVRRSFMGWRQQAA